MKFWVLLLLVTGLTPNVFALFGMEAKYQHDADIYRLRHMKYYGELIRDYHGKTGKYPLQGDSEYQHYVHIAAPHQQQYVQGGPPYQHEVTGLEDFRKNLEKGLGRPVEFRFDPQKVPTAGPNFYIYMVQGDSYFFAVHLYNERPFANPLGRHYHKLEISNTESRRRGLWTFENLLKNETYIQAVDEEPYKKAWFDQLEERYK